MRTPVNCVACNLTGTAVLVVYVDANLGATKLLFAAIVAIKTTAFFLRRIYAPGASGRLAAVVPAGAAVIDIIHRHALTGAALFADGAIITAGAATTEKAFGKFDAGFVGAGRRAVVLARTAVFKVAQPGFAAISALAVAI